MEEGLAEKAIGRKVRLVPTIRKTAENENDDEGDSDNGAKHILY
jgi:hypothetical protein